MKFEEQKSELIEKGKHLLGFVTKQDRGWGIKVDVMDDAHRNELNEWFYSIEEFVERYGLNCQKERLNGIDIINGKQVNVAGVNVLLEIINRIEQ
jgi:hypothetical protein